MTDHLSSSRPPQILRAVRTENEVDLLVWLKVLWRGKLLLFLAMLLFAILGGYYAYNLTERKFSATSIVVFSPDQGGLLDLENIVTGASTDSASINTEIAIIKSRETLEQLVKDLNLTEVAEFNPSLNKEDRPFSPVTALKKLLGLIPEPEELTPEQEAALILRYTTQNVGKAIEVETQRDTYLLLISAVSTNRALSADIANTLASIYIEGRGAKAFAATEQAIDWLSERARGLETELREKEEEINKLRSETDLINREALERMGFQVKDFRDRLNDRTEDLAQSRARLALLTETVESGDPEEINAVFGDFTLRRILQNRNDGTAPLSAAFQTRVEALLAAQEAEINRAEREVQVLTASRDRLQEQVEEQTRDLQRLEQMERELKVTQDLYQTFLTGLQEVTVQVGLVQTDATLMSQALPPLNPFSPNTKLIVAISGLLGALLASVWLLVREGMSSTIRSAVDLEDLTGEKVLGQIPVLPIRRRRDLVRYLHDKPTSPAVEAVRNLRTSLLLSNEGHEQKVILFTSSIPGEGKTTLAISLAVNLAGLGKRVLLVDADIRRNTLKQYFPEGETGPDNDLLRVLEGSVALKDAVSGDFLKGVDVLLGTSNLDVNAADLLSSEQFRKFVEDARTHYDHVLLDAPPVLVVPDARVLASHVDALLFAVKWDETLRAQVQDSMRLFSGVGQKVTGLALTQINPRKQKRYSYSGYGAYGYGYGSKSYGGKS